MSSQHIGAAGELLIQYKLLKVGIDSARLTTDSGIDLVAYAPGSSRAVTIQVKTQKQPAPSGGKGPLELGYNFPHALRAQLLALVDLSTDTAWLLSRDEAHLRARQHSANGGRRLYWFIEMPERSRATPPLTSADMAEHLLEQQVGALILAPEALERV